MQEQEFGRLTFREAAPVWLDSRTSISPASRQDYLKNLKRLNPFFGALCLDAIHIGHINTYRTERQQTGGTKLSKGVGASRLNHEMSTLQQILKRAGLWAKIAPWYEPMALPNTGPGIALEDEQEERLFRIAQQSPRWKVAFCAALVTANTTAGPGEVRLLQLRDVHLEATPPVIYVREGAKNRFRIRTLPLNEDALWAVRTLWNRARELGASAPEHYLVPHRADVKGERADPTRPASHWYKAWYALRQAAGLPNLRLYDLRHHALTRLLENPDISEQTIKDMAGQVSRKMLDHYSHIRLKAKMAAAEALCSSRAPVENPALRAKKAVAGVLVFPHPERQKP